MGYALFLIACALAGPGVRLYRNGRTDLAFTALGLIGLIGLIYLFISSSPLWRQILVLWLRRNKLLVAGAMLAIFTVISYTVWWRTGSRVWLWIGHAAAILTIILLIAYSCRWGNWCNKVGPWWRNTIWPGLKTAWNKVWGFAKVFGPKAVAFICKWTCKILWFLLVHSPKLFLLGSILGLLYSIFYGKLWVSGWWWLVAFIVAVFINFPWCRRFAKLMVQKALRKAKRRLLKSWMKLSFWQQAKLICFALIAFSVIMWLLATWMTTGVAFGERIRFTGIDGIGTVIGVGLLGGSVLWGMAATVPKPKKKKAAR